MTELEQANSLDWLMTAKIEGEEAKQEVEDNILNISEIQNSAFFWNLLYRYIFRNLFKEIFYNRMRTFLGLQKNKLVIEKRKTEDDLLGLKNKIEELEFSPDEKAKTEILEIKKKNSEVNKADDSLMELLKENNRNMEKNRNIYSLPLSAEGTSSVEYQILKFLSFKNFVITGLYDKNANKYVDYDFKVNFKSLYNEVKKKLKDVNTEYRKNEADYSFISFVQKNKLLKDTAIDTFLKELQKKSQLNYIDLDHDISINTAFETFKGLSNVGFSTLRKTYSELIMNLYKSILFDSNNQDKINLASYEAVKIKYLFEGIEEKWFIYPPRINDLIETDECKDFINKINSNLILINQKGDSEYDFMIRGVNTEIINDYKELQKIIIYKTKWLNQRQIATKARLASDMYQQGSEKPTIINNVNVTLYISNNIDFIDIQEEIKKLIQNEDIMTQNLKIPEGMTLDEYFDYVSKSADEKGNANENIRTFYNLILKTLVEMWVSDIHIHPMAQEDKGHIQYKLHGRMNDFKINLPWRLIDQFIGVIEQESGMEIKDDKVQDDGVIQDFPVNNNLVVNFRVAVQGMPSKRTGNGTMKKHAVLRVLKNDRLPTLEDLKMREDVVEELNTTINSVEHGIYLVTWPTGSGKSTLLYSVLDGYKKKNPEKMIYSVENPIEKVLNSISQIEIDPKRNMNFQVVLKMLLRMDPDVIFVWEIRDPETATLAADASETGHFVLATLHVNSALEVVERLQALEVLPDKIRKTLVGACAQRLVYHLCPDCKEAVSPDIFIEEMRKTHGVNIPKVDAEVIYKRWGGCSKCKKTGIVWRIPILEMINFKRIGYYEGTEWLKKRLAESNFVSMFDRAYWYMIEEDSNLDYEQVIALYDANTDVSWYLE